MGQLTSRTAARRSVNGQLTDIGAASSSSAITSYPGNEASSLHAIQGLEHVTRCTSCGNFAVGPIAHNIDADTSNQVYFSCKRCAGFLAWMPNAIAPLAPPPRNLPLRYLHVQPFIETMSEELKYSSGDYLLNELVRPHFQKSENRLQPLSPGDRLQIQEVDFKVVGTHPPLGIVVPDTQIMCSGKSLSALNQIVKLHVLPTAASIGPLQLDARTIFTDYVRPFFSDETKHVALGDFFMSNNIQFKIIAAQPENGVVGSSSEIFTNGDPLPDINRVHILPIYETLPNNEKNITADQSFDRYIAPYFTGQFRFVRRRERINIDGVHFTVAGIEPDAGLVTLKTIIYANGNPQRAEDLRRQQEEEDERMAREMQMREQHRMTRYPMPIHLHSLIQLQNALPEDDPQRRLVQSLHDQLVQRQQMGMAIDPQFINLFRMASGFQQPPQRTGASQEQIDSLPTRIYHARNVSDEEKKKDSENYTCMVCLSEFEDGEELRTLPCFHQYHKDCIDIWLKTRKAQCPICKHAI